MRPWLEEKFANPHSPSTWGREAAAAIEVARGQIVRAIGRDDGCFAFTSGATEALNWALKGTTLKQGRNRIVTVATEHAAVLDTCEWLAGQGVDLTILPVGSDGLIDVADLERELDERVGIVTTMLVNNEIGVIQPIAEIARLAHSAGALMICDAVQGFGRMAIPDGPDLIAVSGHKIHGPKGVGGLWMRTGAEPGPLLHGGGQEQGLRSGTLSPALCAGFGEAARLVVERREADAEHVTKLFDLALATLGQGWIVNGSTSHRYKGNLNIRREGVDAARLIADLRDIAFSLGSACASGSGRPSHVLRALGLDYRESRSSIRLGFGRYTTQAELVDACHRLAKAAVEQEKLDA